MFQERKCMMGTLLNPTGLYHRLPHAEMLDICVSLTQIIFARTWKYCKKSKVGLSHWSLPPQSLRLHRRGLTFLPSYDCTESHIRRGSFMKKEKKEEKKNMTAFDGSEEDEAALVLLLTRLSLLSTFVAPQGAATS